MPAPVLHGQRLLLRSIVAADVDELMRIAQTPEVQRWWGPLDRERVERWLADDDVTRWAIVVDGAVAGKIQSYESDDDDYRHAGIDVFLDPALHGRGLGQEAIRVVLRWQIHECRYHRVIIDPALANTRAIRSYEEVGFKRVGVMRRYWRDPATGEFVDGLLLDLLADDVDL